MAVIFRKVEATRQQHAADRIMFEHFLIPSHIPTVDERIRVYIIYVRQ